MARQKLSPQQRREYEWKRNARHRHNGFSGSYRWARSFLRDVQHAHTTTDEARQQAAKVELELDHLGDLLTVRRPGT